MLITGYGHRDTQNLTEKPRETERELEEEEIETTVLLREFPPTASIYISVSGP